MESKRIFSIAVLTAAGSVINMLSTVYDFNFSTKPGEKFLAANACLIVLSAKKMRKPPSFLRLDVFLVPVVLGYILNLMPVINKADYRSICMAIAIVLTWRSVLNRNKYVDPYTGFFNRDFLSSMNEYMEKSGYPNGVGVYFNVPGNGDKLIPVLNGLKPRDAEIFSLGDDEYLLMAGPQKESVLKLLIKGIKIKASREDSSMEISTSVAIREKNRIKSKIPSECHIVRYGGIFYVLSKDYSLWYTIPVVFLLK